MTTTTISPGGPQPPVLQAVPAGSRVFSLSLEHGHLAPAAARHAARPVLEAWGLAEDRVYDTLLVISELVTNAVTHALPPVVLHLHGTMDGSGRVQVHVTDGGPNNAARPGQLGGRQARRRTRPRRPHHHRTRRQHRNRQRDRPRPQRAHRSLGRPRRSLNNRPGTRQEPPPTADARNEDDRALSPARSRRQPCERTRKGTVFVEETRPAGA
ncbi:ATP-binding protein [Streptomyces sp. NBC_01077]|uniref:ATP-binding protein n=1 Tax=Streptomyces sp. NBC_01077 TaxID=2903746 RepID=UPI003870D8D8|nr:ATP-binding protein [Streptomyces sp. NBC_01077]WSV43747.1 ATP-binding protein [Streptomyces sp. NBC_01077]